MDHHLTPYLGEQGYKKELRKKLGNVATYKLDIIKVCPKTIIILPILPILHNYFVHFSLQCAYSIIPCITIY